MDLLPPDPRITAHHKRLEGWIDRLMDEWATVQKLKPRPRACDDSRCDGVRAIVQEIHREASPFSVMLLAETLVTHPELRWLRHFVGHTFMQIEFPAASQRQQAASTN